ncbi:MAG: efflux RND transporter permease subunit [Myxococcales bacterium]|nr:efflux RND transporter permease subunit [Myxococcales bacterium]
MGLLSSMAVRRAVTFSMLYLMIVGFGLFSFSQLKLDLFPELKFPTIAIVNNYTGVGPEEIETLVARRIESAVASVKNVKRISTTAKLGASLMIVELEWGTNIDQSMMDIREKIDLVRKLIPEEARQPILFAFDPSLQPILLVAVNTTGNLTQIKDLIDRRVKPLIERLPGVASANITGGSQREIQVLINPTKMQAYGVSATQILQALNAENVQVASGILEQGAREFSLRTMGNFTNVDQMKNVVIGYKNQGTGLPQPVFLYQIAQIIDGEEEATRAIRSDGKNGMMLMIQKRSDANTVLTVKRVEEELPRLKNLLPPGTGLSILFNQSDIITQSISNLQSSAGQAFFLAVLVLLFFLRSFRTSFIIALSIPISVISTFSVMYIAGITLNIISMAGLALAVGMLVDNSIVVLENIYRHFEEGKSAWDASIQGSKEVGVAIMASTLTTLAVFIPILFVPGIAGALFRDMVITICFSLTASLIVAITLIPLMSSRLLTPKSRNSHKNPGAFGRFVEWMLVSLDGVYVGVLGWSLKWRKTTIALGFGTLFVVIGLMGLMQTDFLPKTDDSTIMLQFERSPGTSLQETLRTGDYMEMLLRRKYGRAIESVIIEAGVGEGFAALFGKGSYAGQLRARLCSISKRNVGKWEIIEEMQKMFQRIPDLKVTVQDVGPGSFGGQGDIDIQLYGYDFNIARTLADRVKREMIKLPNVTSVTSSLEDGKPELQIQFHRDRIHSLGLSPIAIGNTISTAFKGSIATLFRDKGSEYNVLVRFQEKYRNKVEHLKRLLITTPRGKTVPLETIADVKMALSPVKIERKDQQRVAIVGVNVVPGTMGAVVDKVRNVMDTKINMPAEFYYKLGGKAEDFITSFQWLGVAFLVSILLVYMVMASQFESLFAPFVILFSIPLSGIGVLLALLITQTPLSIMAVIGVVMLVGIVVNNAIVLIDFIIQIRQEKEISVVDAALEAGRVRLRPILMTTATTVLGMLPLALGIGEGSENWMGLGRVVMGGMISSTLLTLVIVPVFYCSLFLTFEKIKARFFSDTEEKKSQEPPADDAFAAPTH